MTDKITALQPTVVPQVSRYRALIQLPGTPPPRSYIPSPELEKQVQSFLMMHRMPSFRQSVPRTILIQGPPGSGKTAITLRAGLAMGTAVLVTPPSIFASKHEGGGVEQLTEMLQEAERYSASSKTHIAVLFDDVDHSTLSVAGDNVGHTVNTGTMVGHLQHLSHARDVHVCFDGTCIPFLATSNAADRIAPSLFRDMRAKRVVHVVSESTKQELAHRLFRPIGNDERRLIDKLFNKHRKESIAFWPALRSSYDQERLAQFISSKGHDVEAAERALGIRAHLDEALLFRLAETARKSRPANFLWTSRNS